MTKQIEKEMFRDACEVNKIPFVSLSTDGIRKYSIPELASISVEERHAVRDEALRRHALAVKRLIAAQAEVNALESVLKGVM